MNVSAAGLLVLLMYLVAPASYIAESLDLFILASLVILAAIFLVTSVIEDSYPQIIYKNSSKLVFSVLLVLYVSSVIYILLETGINPLTVLNDFDFATSENIRSKVYSQPGLILIWVEYAPMLLCLFLIRNNRYLAFIVYLLCGYIFTIFGSRGHLINLTLFLFIGFYYLGVLRLKVIYMPIMFFIGLSGFFLLTFIKLGVNVDQMDIVVDALLHRISMGIEQCQKIVSYADTRGFEYGYSYIRDLLTLSPDYQVGTNKYLSIVISGRTDYGNFTPTIVGETYLNFGVLSLLFLAMYPLGVHFLGRYMAADSRYLEIKVMLALIMVKMIVNGFSGMISAVVFCCFVLLMYGLEYLIPKRRVQCRAA